MSYDNRRRSFVLVILTVSLGLGGLLVAACEMQPGVIKIKQVDSESVLGGNPPAPGFNLEGSDSRAIEIANRVMRNMGGRKAWDETRYLSWNFFGHRTHYWDKQTGDTRIEYPTPNGGRMVLLYNINTREGTAYNSGNEVDEKVRASMAETAWRFWVNDSYWLVMPYKLKDTGVTLKHRGSRNMEDGRAAEVLELTFESVGVTPENKYEVFVGLKSGLVEQWAYYSQKTEKDPTFITPWTDWKPYGRIKLAGGRGNRTLTNIAVFDDLPPSVFTSPEPVNIPDPEPEPEG